LSVWLAFILQGGVVSKSSPSIIVSIPVVDRRFHPLFNPRLNWGCLMPRKIKGRQGFVLELACWMFRGPLMQCSKFDIWYIASNWVWCVDLRVSWSRCSQLDCPGSTTHPPAVCYAPSRVFARWKKKKKHAVRGFSWSQDLG